MEVGSKSRDLGSMTTVLIKRSRNVRYYQCLMSLSYASYRGLGYQA